MTATVSSMAMVHEDMHQRARQQQHERQRTQEVGAVLAQQKVSGDGTEHHQTQAVPGAPKWRRLSLAWLYIVVVVHLEIPRG